MNDVSERVATNEAKLASIMRDLEEHSRQRAAMWKRIDEIQENIDSVKLEEAKESGRLEVRLGNMEKNSLRDTYTLRGQVAEIGWRVGVIVGAAFIVLNFILGKINVNTMFGQGQKNEILSSRKR